MYQLQEKGLIAEDADVDSFLEFYTTVNNIELTINDFAMFAATLANGGINPETEHRCINNPLTIKNTLSHMLSCGMNTFSGEWAFKMSLPAKSGISGVTIMVVPNLGGVAVYSPPLDNHFNSVKATEFLQRFVYHHGYNSTDYTYGDGLKKKNEHEHKTNPMHLIFHAAEGNLRMVRKMLARGLNVNYADYDGRTALHLAISNGHEEVVQYLVMHGANPNMKDIQDQDGYAMAEH